MELSEFTISESSEISILLKKLLLVGYLIKCSPRCLGVSETISQTSFFNLRVTIYLEADLDKRFRESQILTLPLPQCFELELT